MLDYDKPLSEQHLDVQAALAKLDPDTYSPTGLDYSPEETGQMIYMRMANSPLAKTQADASKVLRQAGIPGIRYLDQSSRDAGKGTSNFVVFDPADMTILERNGMTAQDVLAQEGKGLVPPVQRVAPQDEALRLAQERAALPVEQGGLGLPVDNTPEQRAMAQGVNTDVYHGSKQNITGAFKPGYDDNLAFVTKYPEFANNWIGKGKNQKRLSKEAEQEVNAAEEEYRKMKMGMMDYDSLNKMQGEPFHTEYDRRNDVFKNVFEKTIGISPSNIHNTMYPLKVQANKTFNPETDMDIMADFFKKNDIPKSSQDLYAGGNYMMYETKPVVDYLKSKGFDSMQLRESTGDNYPTIAVFNPETVRSRFAAFDPWRRSAAVAAAMGVAAPDLMADEKQKPAKKNIVPPVKKQGK
jgi:hypothetical protein